MDFVPAQFVMQVELVGTLHAQVVENTLYVRRSTGWNQTQWDILASIVEQLANDLSASLSQQLAWTRVDGTDLTSQTAPTYSTVFANPITGNLSSPALPGSVAFCVSFRTAGRGRSSRGRNYVPGLAEDQVTGNSLSLAVISGLLASYSAFNAALPDESMEWGVLSRVSGGLPRSAGLFQPVTSVVATDINVDSQRRRLSGRGPAG